MEEVILGMLSVLLAAVAQAKLVLLLYVFGSLGLVQMAESHLFKKIRLELQDSKHFLSWPKKVKPFKSWKFMPFALNGQYCSSNFSRINENKNYLLIHNR